MIKRNRSSLPISPVFAAVVSIFLSACDGGASFSGRAETVPQVAPVAIAVDSESQTIESENDVTAAAAEQPAVSTADIVSFVKEVVDAKGSFRLMPMGDSITQGVRGAGSYRLELKNLMADAGCPVAYVGSQSTTSPDVGFYGAHEGYSGHSTTNFLEGRGTNQGAAVNVDYHKPDVVLLHIGSVDIWRESGVADTLARIDQLVSVIQSAKPNTFVLLANVIPWIDVSNGADKPMLVEQLGDQIEAYVAQVGNPLLQLVDVRSGFDTDLLQDDLIHPNAAGDAHIADAFFDLLHSDAYCGS